MAEEETGEVYPFEFNQGVVDPGPCLRAVARDASAGIPAGVIAARFHNGLARMLYDVCVRLRQETGLDEIALSGGVFQNVTLLKRATRLLQGAGFTIYTHRLVPPNDACISLGQAVVASTITERYASSE
jgi:hydrogenase maturation protein HypF